MYNITNIYESDHNKLLRSRLKMNMIVKCDSRRKERVDVTTTQAPELNEHNRKSKTVTRDHDDYANVA